MPLFRIFVSFLALSFLTGCVRGREERLPDEQAGDREIFESSRRDVETRLLDKLAGMEARFSALRMKAPAAAIAARPELARAVNEGPALLATARTQLSQLRGSTRTDWEVLRKQTEETIANAEAIWQEFQDSNRR